MNLNYIKAFYFVAKLGSISKAARHLKLAQPTVTKKVQLLEEEVNQSLITRTARGAKLTDQGRQFYSHAKKIIEEIAILEKQFYKPVPEVVQIATTQGIGAYLLPKALTVIKDKSLPVELRISPDLSLDFLMDTDIYIGPFVEDLEKTHQINHLHDFKFHFYASKEYLQKRGTPKRVMDLKDHDLISFADERRSAFEETKLSFLLTDPEFQKPYIKTKSAFSELDMASRGAGVALLSEIGVRHFQSKLERLELNDFEGIKTPAYAFMRKDIGRDKASFIQKLLSFFKDDLRQLSLKA